MQHATKILAVAAVVPILYVAVYLLERATRATAVALKWREPTYRVGGTFARQLFTPAQSLDQRFRPAYWDFGWDDLVRDLDE